MKRFNILYAVLLMLFVFSCEKGLDLSPEDVVTESSFFNSKKDYRLFATNFYRYLPRPAFDDRNTDIGFKEGGSDISRGTLIAPQKSDFWNNSYVSIRACNYLLKKSEGADDKLKAEIGTYIGEAYFFRAMLYL